MFNIFDALREIGHPVPSVSYPTQFPCPFHKGGNESSPSARLYPETDSFHCFTCGQSYTPVSTLSTHFGWSYGATLSHLERRFGKVSTRLNLYFDNRKDKDNIEHLLVELLRSVAYAGYPNQFQEVVDGLLARSAQGESYYSLKVSIMETVEELWSTLRQV